MDSNSIQRGAVASLLDLR